MKVKTALKQSRASVRFLAVVVPLVWLAFWRTHAWGFALIAGFMTLYLIMDVVNIFLISREAGKDPTSLEKRIT